MSTAPKKGQIWQRVANARSAVSRTVRVEHVWQVGDRVTVAPHEMDGRRSSMKVAAFLRNYRLMKEAQ